MKIQCNACEAAEADVLCCADEAALCLACDEKIHAANKLASKHQRVPLSSSSSHMPKCDICQETVGYFFCLQDRALLCRKCDVGIHMANSFVSGHQRFLLTGVKVGLGASEPGGSSTTEKSNYVQNFTDTSSSQSISIRGAPIPWSGESNEAVSGQLGEIRAFSRSKVNLAGATAPGSFSEWGLCEFLGLTDVNQNDGSMTSDSSKVDGRYYQ